MEEKYIYQAGSKPPEGTYICMQCGSDDATYAVSEMVEELPVCPICNGTQWMKV